MFIIGGKMKKIVYLLLLVFFTACSGKVNGYSWNNLQSINQGGVQIQIARIAIYDKSSMPKDQQKYLNGINGFYDKSTICDLYFKITNSSDVVMSVYPTQGLLMANDEEVQLISYGLFSDGISGGQIFPGATVNGVITFGLKRVTPDTINIMKLKISAPHDELFRTYGEDYLFNLDLSKHEWVNKPKELE